MPTLLIKIPRGSFPHEYRASLATSLIAAAARAEQIPDDPAKRFTCWAVIEEVEPGAWICGAADVSAQVLTCMAVVYLPAGVLDSGAKANCQRWLHDAFKSSLPPSEKRQLATSIILHEVADGAWAANGQQWRLPDLARSSGYLHLQHLVAAS